VRPRINNRINEFQAIPMLYAALNRLGLCACAASIAAMSVAQVRSTTRIEFIGAPGERRIDGLGEPAAASAAVTVEGSLRSGSYTWCEAVVAGDSVLLSPMPEVDSWVDGTVLRFIAPAALQGAIGVKVPGQPGLALVRTDGLRLVPGQIPEGYVVEGVQAGGQLFVINTVGEGCPPGFSAAHGNLCMETASVPGLLFRQAVERCASLGGKLCAWDEYIAGCTLTTGQLTGQFVDWEWIDDSSNHGHGADQAGRFTCASQRHFGLIATTPARTRCCFRSR
jgi:hypothetical protein